MSLDSRKSPEHTLPGKDQRKTEARISTLSKEGMAQMGSDSSSIPTNKRSKKHCRQRKSKIQREALWGLFKKLEGRPPKRSQILELAANVGLKEQ